MRKTFPLLLALFALQPLAQSLEREPWQVFGDRRARLREKLSDGVTVLFAYTAMEGQSLRNTFRQENNFYYLTGWSEPGAIVMLIPPMKEKNSPLYREISDMPREIFFLPAHNSREERWTGPKVAAYDSSLRDRTGFEVVHGVEAFERELSKAVAGFGKIYALKPRERASDRDLEPSRGRTLEKIAPLTEIHDARPSITGLRMVKSNGEIDLVQKATDASVAAHLAAWKRAKPGLYEYQIAATMLGLFLDRGCERPAYSPIVGAGFNSTVLHYSENSSRMDAGQVLLMDVAAEYSMYATDITRTIPVGGKFSARQREIYDIVLGAQNAAFAAARPGMSLARTGPNSLHQIAYQYINTHGKDLQGNPLGQYFIHGLGHHVGLEVHDPSTPDTSLAAGMIITLEPGIYLPDEKIGVRIEDIVVITENGAKLMSGALPREPAEVERAMH